MKFQIFKIRYENTVMSNSGQKGSHDEIRGLLDEI